MFITVEGIEGVGKSTAVGFIHACLTERGHDVVLTREPGGTPMAEAIRLLLKQPSAETLSADAELLLVFASRAQHVAERVRPMLAAGRFVVSDRFTDATYAYQGGGRGISERFIGLLEEWVLKGLRPDLTFLLDAPVAVAMKRIVDRGQQDRFDSESAAFFQLVREAYLNRAKSDPHRFRVIDASLSQDRVAEQIKTILDKL